VITVEAMDGTSQDWNINVSHRDLYTSNDIEAFLFNGQLGSSDININDGSVTANVSANEDLSSIAPYVLVSDGATVIVNGSQYENGSIVDFSSPVVFTVISEAGIQKAWTVTITQKTPVFDITISGNAAITTDGGTIQLSADVLPVDADNRNILWTVSTGATIDETGLLTAVQNGTVTVKAIAEDGSGVYREYVVTISGQITSINHPQQEAGSKVMVYPNPVSSVLYIDIEGDVGQEIEYKLINIKGDAVISQSMMNTGSTGEVNVDHLDNGIYFLVIKINDALIVKNVICN
jgi:hypothetical protein